MLILRSCLRRCCTLWRRRCLNERNHCLLNPFRSCLGLLGTLDCKNLFPHSAVAQAVVGGASEGIFVESLSEVRGLDHHPRLRIELYLNLHFITDPNAGGPAVCVAQPQQIPATHDRNPALPRMPVDRDRHIRPLPPAQRLDNFFRDFQPSHGFRGFHLSSKLHHPLLPSRVTLHQAQPIRIHCFALRNIARTGNDRPVPRARGLIEPGSDQPPSPPRSNPGEGSFVSCHKQLRSDANAANSAVRRLRAGRVRSPDRPQSPDHFTGDERVIGSCPHRGEPSPGWLGASRTSWQ